MSQTKLYFFAIVLKYRILFKYIPTFKDLIIEMLCLKNQINRIIATDKKLLLERLKSTCFKSYLFVIRTIMQSLKLIGQF